MPASRIVDKALELYRLGLPASTAIRVAISRKGGSPGTQRLAASIFNKAKDHAPNPR